MSIPISNDSSNRIFVTKEVVLSGFKSLITGIDAAAIKALPTPAGAVSYKNKLEPLALTNNNELPEDSSNAYKDRVNRFT